MINMFNQNEMFLLSNLVLLCPEILISCSILQLSFYSISTSYQRKYGFIVLNHQIYNVGVLILFFSTLLLLNEDSLMTGFYNVNNCIINDYFSFSAKLIICITSVFYLLILKININDEPIHHNFEFLTLILTSILGSLLICSSNDLLTAYLSIELQSISFYLLAAFKKNSSYSVESGLKYFIVGSLSSAFFLFGSSIIYGCMGSINFHDFKTFISLLHLPSSSFQINYVEKFNNLCSIDDCCLFGSKLFYYFFYVFILKIWANKDYGSLEVVCQDFYYAKSPYLYSEETFDLFSWVTEQKGENSIFLEDLKKIYEFETDKSVRDSVVAFDQDTLQIRPDMETLAEKFGYNVRDLDMFINLATFRNFPGIIASLNFEYLTDNTFQKKIVVQTYFEPILGFSICPDQYYFLRDKADSFSGLNVLINNLDMSKLNPTFEFLNSLWFHLLTSSGNSIHDVNNSMLNLNLVSIGFIFICVSLFIKLALAPFHFWSLDVYEGSPNATTTFFAIVPKIAIFVLLVRICYFSFFECFYDTWQPFFFFIAFLSVLVGSVGGLEQRKLKTLLAYSSISNTGYLMLAFSTGSLEGVFMMFYYLTIFMISGLCFWSVFLFLKPKRSKYLKKHNKELGDLVLLRKSNPMLALILSITLFSIAGIPPIVGFLAKLGVFLSVMGSSAYLISVLTILLSVISTFYYIRIIKILYFENILVGKLYHPISTNKALIISTLSLLLIILCINPTILYLFFIKASMLSFF